MQRKPDVNLLRTVKLLEPLKRLGEEERRTDSRNCIASLQGELWCPPCISSGIWLAFLLWSLFARCSQLVHGAFGDRPPRGSSRQIRRKSSLPPPPEERPYCIAASCRHSTVSSASICRASRKELRSVTRTEKTGSYGSVAGLSRRGCRGLGDASGRWSAWLLAPRAVYPAAKDLYQKYRTEVLQNSSIHS